MLTELRLENFKIFGPEVVIPCGRISLLTGINGKGKSTSIQALLLLHQSVDRALVGTRLLERVELNGRYARLGTFRELQNRDRPKGEPVQIGLEFSDAGAITTNTRLSLKQEDEESRWADISRIEVERFDGDTLSFNEVRSARDGESSITLDLRVRRTLAAPENSSEGQMNAPTGDEIALASRLEQLGRVHYVSADRLGPQDFFPWSTDVGFFSVGVHGERTAEVLYQSEREHQTVEDARARKESETIVVTDQASAWLSYIFDGGAVRVLAPHSTILTLEMNTDGSPHYHRPVNLGFGYSYALPIIVAGLIAQPGEILVVENPEAHLHPLAQSRLGEFLAIVSSVGVQVFVESHSEHILNAFRFAVKDKLLDAESLSVLYFRRDSVEPVMKIPVEATGRIPFWPDGFFDQRTHDFLRLFGER